MATRTRPTVATVLSKLATISTETARCKLLARHPRLVCLETVTRLAEMVVERIRISTQEAVYLAEAAVLVAHRTRRKEAMALASRAKANALYAFGDNRAAMEHHRRACRLYESLGNWKEAARTLSTSIQPLILLGEYDQAFQAADRAREIFTRLNEQWRLARLQINVGNIYHRLDRFEEAIAHYEQAYEGLLQHEDAEAFGVVLSNMAVCLISLNDFQRALATYQRARSFCLQHKMPLLVAQADYNIAYLYYLRGEYSRAIDALFAARRSCEATGDAYHFALCHLDLSDIYLELNLTGEAREVAREGYLRFQKLGMKYEAAKTLANEATACGQQGKTAEALERFAKAREMFVSEKNPVWPWLIDLYQAVLLFHEGRYVEARRLCAGAASFFGQPALVGKLVLSRLLLARIALRLGDLALAKKETGAAIAKLRFLRTPALTYEARFLEGQLARAQGKLPRAKRAFLEARKALETLRSGLHGEELKISFVKNKMQVYEALVELYLGGADSGRSTEEAFACIEAAKSRSMIEMIFQSGQSLLAGQSGQSPLLRRIRELREDLNWYYHRIELEQLRPDERSRQRLQSLRQTAYSHEKELLRSLRELPSHERKDAVLEPAADFSLSQLQSVLPRDATLVEYFVAGEQIVAAVIAKDVSRIVPLGPLSRVTDLLRLLRFQFAKFQMGRDYVSRFAEPLLRATESHLETLHQELLAPLRPFLSGKHLIFVPHGPLHYLPFHALKCGEQYVCDAHTVSYAPSAAIFSLCRQKSASAATGCLVLGVADERAPLILEEVRSVAALLPGSSLHLGEDATSALLREKGPTSEILHLATHGVYRQDNPMFSGIRLGDGYLNLYDLYQMRLNARLVTLSGCATGMNFVAAGDELMGLQRGLFCAGATTLLLSLWDVHDESTAQLMTEFYKNFIQGRAMELALQGAMTAMRRRMPHPYYWAPFVLAGKIHDVSQSAKEREVGLPA